MLLLSEPLIILQRHLSRLDLSLLVGADILYVGLLQTNQQGLKIPDADPYEAFQVSSVFGLWSYIPSTYEVEKAGHCLENRQTHKT